MKVLPVHQLYYSGPLHAVDDYKKHSESAVGFVQQWKPSIFAVKILAVSMVIQDSEIIEELQQK